MLIPSSNLGWWSILTKTFTVFEVIAAGKDVWPAGGWRTQLEFCVRVPRPACLKAVMK
jgi:hypothetical protein